MINWIIVFYSHLNSAMASKAEKEYQDRKRELDLNLANEKL